MATVRQPDLRWIYELYLLGQKAAQENNSDDARMDLLRHITTFFEARSGSLSEVNANDSSLTIVSGIDIPDHVIGSRIGFETGILGWVAENAEPLILNSDTISDPRFRSRIISREGNAPESAMCWPLIVEHEVIGVLSINRDREKPAFQSDDLEIGRVIMEFFAIAFENVRLHARNTRNVKELRVLVKKLEDAQNQLLQSEKMASIGQLAAGVAHEINNPVGYIGSNLSTLTKYVGDILNLVEAYESADGVLKGAPAMYQEILNIREEIEIDYLKEDLHALIDESLEGVDRVKRIVRDLKDFSHVDEAEWQEADLHKCLDSTLNIVHNEIKYKAEVRKEYGELPLIYCMPSQLNQVFMNLLVNAVHAIEDHGVITIRTGTLGDGRVSIEISDTGMGIPPENLNKLFDPFFTTKPVGEGTGLGLSLSFGIIEKHKGRIEVESEMGKGSTFRIFLPIHGFKEVKEESQTK